MTEKLSVGILEDDPDMQGYLTTVLGHREDIEIVFCEATIAKATTALQQAPVISICLVDLQLPDGNGTDFVRHLTANTTSKALILTVLGDKLSVLDGLEAGAHGYLLKDTAPNQIIRHIRDTIAGANPISPQAATHLLKFFQDSPFQIKPDTPASKLTDRETDILTLFAKGLSYKETAQTLNISPHTVSDYVKSIYAKLSVHSRNEAVFEALQMGWIDL